MRKMSKTKRERDELIELIAFIRHYLHAPIRILVRIRSSYPRCHLLRSLKLYLFLKIHKSLKQSKS